MSLDFFALNDFLNHLKNPYVIAVIVILFIPFCISLWFMYEGARWFKSARKDLKRRKKIIKEEQKA